MSSFLEIRNHAQSRVESALVRARAHICNSLHCWNIGCFEQERFGVFAGSGVCAGDGTTRYIAAE